MPGNGKYPTITPQVWGPNDQAKARQEKRKTLFGTSPILNKQVTDQTVIDTGNAFLKPDAPVTGNPIVGAVNLDFSGQVGGITPPDFTKDVPVGGGGLPETPWTPNQASPGAANPDNLADVNGVPQVNTKALTIPVVDVTPIELNHEYVLNDDNTISPKITAPKIAGTKLGDR
jgi:hypothetical protein